MSDLRNVPPGVPESMITPTGNVPAIGIGTSQDYARLIFSAPYFEQIAIAEIIQPSVTEAVENVLPSLIPPYVDAAVLAGIQQYSVLLSGSTMTGPLFLNPLMPTADAQAATKAYVDAMVATAGIPEVPPVPVGQIWGRETGQWVPIDLAGGTFLPISGGTMQGIINMSGNTITNMAAVPAMPNGAAPAQWVLNQIASVSLYQGTWNADTNTPDLTQLSVRVNGYTWIAITTDPAGVVIGAAIPGLQGLTIYNGDTIIYSTVQGQFSSIHAGGLSLPEADARYVQLAGSQMSGALLLNADASQPTQAVTLEQLEAAVANTVTPDAPADGQAYLRVGVGAPANRWVPGMPLAGGIFTGAVTLAGPGASGNNPVTVTQLNSAISAAQAGFMPISGGTFTGPVLLSGNATVNLNPVSLGQLNTMLGTYAPLQNAALTGAPTVNGSAIATVATLGNYLPLAGGTLTGALAINGTNGLSVPNGSIVAGAVVQVGGTSGPYWQNNGGAMYCSAGNVQGASIISAPNVAGTNLWVGGYGNIYMTDSQGFIAAANANFMCSAIAIGNNPGVTWSFTGGYMATAPSVMANAFVESSDRRGKTDISAYQSGLAEILQLNPVTFMRPDERRIVSGFIAQEVQPILPEAVAEIVPDSSEETSLDTVTDGLAKADLAEGEALLGLQYSCITAALVNAVKELSAKVDALEAAA